MVLMPTVACLCRQTFEGADEEALYQALLAHPRAAHAELPLSDGRIRDYVDASIRLSRPHDRVADPGPIVMRALTPALLDDYLRFFDEEPFSDRPDWLSCYCVFYCIAHTYADVARRTARESRATAIELMGEGRLGGHLAYAGDRPVGWCNAGPRSARPGLVTSVPQLPADDNGVGAIVCMSISASYRGHGITRRLLDAACDGFKQQGLTIAEAYPGKDAGLGTTGYHGSLAMYRNAGFEPVLEGDRYLVLRKRLA
jgi:GNAT superfamily N-acetyltransferase